MVIPSPVWDGTSPEPDSWAHFEATLCMDERYRWEPLVALDDVNLDAKG
jgi:hypothetical protein